MKQKKPKQTKEQIVKEEAVLTKEQFLANLKKVILTVKKPKSSVKGKKETSE